MTDPVPPAPTPPLRINWTQLGKYAIGATVFGSLFYLVLTGKMQADEYKALCYAALTALGISVAPTSK